MIDFKIDELTHQDLGQMQMYAKEYKLYLPDKKLLQKKLKEWLEEEQN